MAGTSYSPEMVVPHSLQCNDCTFSPPPQEGHTVGKFFFISAILFSFNATKLNTYLIKCKFYNIKFISNDGTETVLAADTEKEEVMSGEASDFLKYISDYDGNRDEYFACAEMSLSVSRIMKEIRTQNAIKEPWYFLVQNAKGKVQNFGSATLFYIAPILTW